MCHQATAPLKQGQTSWVLRSKRHHPATSNYLQWMCLLLFATRLIITQYMSLLSYRVCTSLLCSQIGENRQGYDTQLFNGWNVHFPYLFHRMIGLECTTEYEVRGDNILPCVQVVFYSSILHKGQKPLHTMLDCHF